MADPVVGIVNGVPTSGTGNITTLGQTLVDGANATLGVTTGAAVTTSAAGTLQQYLRGIVSLLVSGITVTSHAVTNAGTFAVQAASTLAAETTKVIGVVRAADGSGNLLTSTTNALDVNIKSGVNANGSATSANSAPVVVASDQAAIKTLVSVSATANGATASRVLAAASTNATSLKASAGQLYTVDVFNAAAYNVFLKLYNKASTPTVGTDTPVMTIPVQAGGGYSKTWPMGLPFATGIAYAITKLQADSDTTVVVAGDLTGNTSWV